MRKRGLCCRPVSVGLSVTSVYSVHTAEDIVKLLSSPGSPITSFFIPSADTQFPGERTPSVGDAKYTGWEKFAIFTEISYCLGNGTR